MTTGPGWLIAVSMTAFDVSFFSARRPLMPNASASFTKSGFLSGVATMLFV